MGTNFVVTTESGIVLGYDTRKPDAPVFEFQAHEKACSSISFSPHIPNMMATCSTDEYVKVWDIANNEGTEPKLISYKKMSTMGELFTLSYYKDIPWVLAAGGSKGEIAVWDTEENETIAKHFSPNLDKAFVVEAEVDKIENVEEEDMESEEEVKKKDKKKKKTKQPKKVVKVVNQKKEDQMKKAEQISQGIQKIRELKK